MINHCHNEKGNVLLPALLVMVMLTIFGFSIAATTTIGLSVSNNKRFQKTAFIAAESGLSYVMSNIGLYSTEASAAAVDVEVYFPDKDISSAKQTLVGAQAFNGYVMYTGDRMVPRGSGSEAGMFRAHDYEISCTGYAHLNAEAKITAAFYRIGY